SDADKPAGPAPITMQSFAGPCFSIDEFTSYLRFFFADFLDRFVPDDFELLFDPDFLLARARLGAVDADFDFDADLFALPDFLLEDLVALRCLRSFSASICSPRASICSSLNAASAFTKSSFSSSSTWCSTFSCSTLACASHCSLALLALLISRKSFLTTSCSS